MINRIFKISRQRESGFTLIEVLVTLVLVSIVAIGASALIYHLLGVNSMNANAVTVTTSINSATDYLRDDVQMSNIVTTDPDTGNDVITGIGTSDTEWLWLTWTWLDESKNKEFHRVAYEIEDNKLYRTHTISNTSETLSETRTMISQYIDASGTEWDLSYDLVGGKINGLTVDITISAFADGYRSATESRTIQVVPRV